MSVAPVLDSHSAGSYITFKAGSAEYALSVSHVRYITTLDTLTVRSSPGRNGPPKTLVDYAGAAIPLYRFSFVIGSRSATDESAELIKLLDARRQDHIDWIEALEHSIETGDTFNKATDPSQCAFGQWYDSYKADDQELADIMAKFDVPHRRIHDLAKNLLELSKNPSKVPEAVRLLNEEKSSTLRELLTIFAQARSRLEDLVKPVVLVLEDKGKTFALEVDCIGDILNFDDSNWLPDQGNNHVLSSCYDGFFETKNNQLFLNIVPGLLLKTAETPN